VRIEVVPLRSREAFEGLIRKSYLTFINREKHITDVSDPTFWIPTFVSGLGVLLVYVDMRRRQTSDRDASRIMFGLINTMKQELQLIRQKVGSAGITSQQSLLQRKEQTQWKQLTDLARGFAWLVERWEEFEGDE